MGIKGLLFCAAMAVISLLILVRTPNDLFAASGAAVGVVVWTINAALDAIDEREKRRGDR